MYSEAFSKSSSICWPCHKMGQDHPKVMIYIYFVELLSLMLHARFQNHRPSGSGENILKMCLLFIAMAAILVM